MIIKTAIHHYNVISVYFNVEKGDITEKVTEEVTKAARETETREA